MAAVAQLNQWNIVPYDEAIADALATSVKIPLALARVLAGRGICDVAGAERFLQPALSQLTDPFSVPGMTAAVERTLHAIQTQEKITVYGDYDCDGLTATAILLEVLVPLGAQVDHFIPKRAEDGFGFTLGALDKVLAANGPGLIITADCGMRSENSVAEAREAGVDVIVIDHHRPYGAPRPAAVALISPVQEDFPEAMQTMSSSGLAFVFCRALRSGAIAAGIAAAETLDLWQHLDLVAIGTISDLMLLTGDNRILAYYGLELLNNVSKRRPGVLALIRAAGLRTEIGSYEVGFLMEPRLGAAGRVGNPDLALRLLRELDGMEARRLAGQLDACNRERRRIEDGVLQEATESVASAVKENACGLVAVGQGWHIGTIGIVAARLCGRFHRPAVVISCDENGNGRGSCRSAANVNLEAIFRNCMPYLEDYGGYTSSAGFVIQQSQIGDFRQAFEEGCRTSLAGEEMTEQFEVDAWISLSEADDALLDAVKCLQPMGLGNQTPIWGVRNIRVQGPAKVVGDNHLKLTLVSGATQRDAIGYGLGYRKVPEGPLDVLFQLQRNHFRGQSMLQLSVKDFRASGFEAR
ncbi:MAG: single-stranded-DNA-specific exonuclease RecJ [Kiritimatiellia bacterium]